MTFIGSAGHGVDALRERAAELGAADHVTFHGFISDQRRIDEILRQCDIGVAIYLDDPNAPMIYGDPAKVKRYLAAGLAVITSAVAVIAPEIEQFQAGRVVTNNKDEFCRAVRELAENPQKLAQFRKNALPLARKYLDAEILKDVWDDL
jgi:glycosyltransferase involved in cell wall biosynthesis